MPAPLRGGLVMHVQNAQIHYGGIEQQHTDVELEQTQPAACLTHTQGHNRCIFYCSSQSSANAHHAVAFLARRGYELELSLTHTHTAYELELSLTHTHTAYELEFCKPKLTVVRECAVCAFVRSALALPLTGALDIKGEKDFFGNPDWDPATSMTLVSRFCHMSSVWTLFFNVEL